MRLLPHPLSSRLDYTIYRVTDYTPDKTPPRHKTFHVVCIAIVIELSYNLPVSIWIPDYIFQDGFDACVQRRLLFVQLWNARAGQLPLSQVQVVTEELEELFTRNFILTAERMIDAIF